MARMPLQGRTARTFDRAMSAPDPQPYVFRLCISGMSPRSQQAVQTVRRICDEYLPGRFSLEVIDVYQQPELAARHHVVATPTLIKEYPNPARRLLGSLQDLSETLRRLGIRTT